MEINKKYKYATLNREKVKAEVSVIEIEDVPGVGTDDVKVQETAYIDYVFKDEEYNHIQLKVFDKVSKGNAMKREFVINNRERMIFCKLNMPEGNQMVPMVILCHGYNGSCEGFTYHQEFLGKRKMASIAFDFCGGSVHSKSSLDTTMMTIETEIEDLIAVYNYVSNMERVDTHHIIFHGESQGGFVSAIAAARLGNKISGLNLVYPALCIPDNWNEKFKNISDIPEVEELWGMKLGKSFFMSLRNIEVYSEICQYTGSVHIVHGDQDEIVPLHYSENAVKKYKNARLAVLSGEGHGFSSEGVEKTLNFFYNSESI